MNFGNGNKTLSWGGTIGGGGFSLGSSSFLTGSLGRFRMEEGILGELCIPGMGIRGRPPNGDIGDGMEGGAMPGKGLRSDNFGSPGIPIGGLVPGGMCGNIPAIGFLASGGGRPRFSASSICFSSGG